MSGEAEFVIDLWEVVRDHVPHNKRGDIAKDLLYACADFGFEAAELATIADADPDLSEAFEEVFPSEYEPDEIEE